MGARSSGHVAPRAGSGWVSDRVNRCTFPRTLRLLEADEFSSVFSYRRTVSGMHLHLHYKPNGLGHGRLGLIVPKKIEKTAVGRNFVRRRAREAFRLRQESLKGLDLVFRLRKTVGEGCDLRRELDELLGRICNVEVADRID